MENNNRKGCRWTKASERLPEENKLYIIKYGRNEIQYASLFVIKHKVELKMNVEWLDESPIEPCATSSEIENDELKAWKESAISVMPDIQAIGKEMGLEIGQAISPKILPYIKELKKEAAEQKEKQESLVIEIEQEKAVSKAWQKVAEEKEKECERWKKTTERFKAEGDKWLNKSISLSKQIAELKSKTPSPTGDRDCEELKEVEYSVYQLTQKYAEWIEETSGGSIYKFFEWLDFYNLEHK